MGGTKAPKDNSLELERMRQAEAQRIQQEEAAKKAAQEKAFNERLGGVHSGAITSALDYFRQQGADPNEYADEVTQRANTIRGGIPMLDANPASYYDQLGQLVYEAEQDAFRSGHMRELDRIAPSGFTTRRIADTSDDAYLDAILQEREAKANEYVRNLLDRGVITSSGYGAAMENIGGQRAGARSRLNELGLGELERGRQGAGNIATQARSDVSNLRLGQQFDPFEVESNLNSSFGSFFEGLGDRLRGAAPADLFTTTGLAGIAGASQGAQNAAFNPNAIAGLADDEDEDDDQQVNPF